MPDDPVAFLTLGMYTCYNISVIGGARMRTKRWISFLLCLLLGVALFPMIVLADGDRYLEINEANFPDATFRQWVKDSLAGGKDYMTQVEVESITSINVRGLGVSTLIGIEHFSALKELYCGSNQLTALDVSHNTALRSLHCAYNQLVGRAHV